MRCFKVAVCVVVVIGLLVIQVSDLQAMNKMTSSEIIINLPSRTLEYYEDNTLIKEYSVAIGKPATPTPLGVFEIIDKEINPSWYPPERKGYAVSSGPDNPLGYRWLGFSGNYGIHGTNAPWSIGSVVSNGCIRMLERDVEELFTYIQYNTPVHITYDRVKLRVDKIGQASIGIYPDVYGYDTITLEQVKNRLVTEKLDGLIEDGFLSQLMAEKKGEQVPFAILYRATINNQQLAEHLVSWENKIYVPVIPISTTLDMAVDWDEQQQFIVGKQHAVPGMTKNNTLYVEVNDLPILFGVQQSWDQEHNCFAIKTFSLLKAGEPVTCNVQLINNRSYVPIFKVATALAKELDWEEKSHTVWLGCRKISVTMLANEPYIEVSKISDYFNVRVTWQEPLQAFDMNDFSDGTDYSMYLGEMGQFVD